MLQFLLTDLISTSSDIGTTEVRGKEEGRKYKKKSKEVLKNKQTNTIVPNTYENSSNIVWA